MSDLHVFLVLFAFRVTKFDFEPGPHAMFFAFQYLKRDVSYCFFVTVFSVISWEKESNQKRHNQHVCIIFFAGSHCVQMEEHCTNLDCSEINGSHFPSKKPLGGAQVVFSVAIM